MKENIEEDIIKLERFSNETILYGSTVAMTLKKYKDLQLSISNILSDYKRVLKENEELKQSLIINKNLYEELCNKNNELKRDNELAKETLKKQCNIADERNQLLKENKDWQRAYQEEKDKQFELVRENQKLQKENEELKEYIMLAPNLDEMTAMKYRNITEEAYIKGRAEEQQKAEQIIYEHYIPKQKIKDKIEEINKKEKQELKGTKVQDRYDIKQQYMYQRNILQDLLESEDK